MKVPILFAIAVLTCTSALAVSPANHAPAKTPAFVVPNVVDPNRQGGDTIADAVVIPSLPFNTTGTTTGYVNDYDEMCPFGGMAPDVVYSFDAPEDWVITVDLCGSDYDTKTYIYDADFQLVACNDDFYFDDACGIYTSKIDDAPVSGLVYIVVDGYLGDHGDYILDVIGGPDVPCVIDCPPFSFPEGEPPLHDDYVDSYNGGCNTPGHPFQSVEPDPATGSATLCGVSGWYLFNGHNYRDTDWFLLPMGPTGELEITADAEQPTYFFELGPQDCENVDVLQMTIVGSCDPGSMTITGYSPGSEVWFWAGSTRFSSPPGAENMYDYVVWITGMPVIAAESTTWSTVKALFR